MPLNTLRLNFQPSSHPNDRIVFIKPIQRPASEQGNYDRAETVLKAIAAQCLPIMKEHHLSVTTLEEYEPNPEFIGRNFNNGEIIQLVLQSKSGAWLPLNMIQMVMMHELAHNTHMNHGKGFWQARNLYANEMRQSWSKGYTGEGLWGRGRTLDALQDTIGGNIVSSQELAGMPLCGGTFRSRRKKRKAKGPDLTWKEKRDKRIEKKFGKNGEALGEDEDKRLSLELGKAKGALGSKPRVAQSKRGRELRAAAALARFDTNKKEVADLEVEKVKKEGDSSTESDIEFEEVDEAQADAKDVNGQRMTDSKGQGLIRVCDEEDADDIGVQQELAELAELNCGSRSVSLQQLTSAQPPEEQIDSDAETTSPSPEPKKSVEDIGPNHRKSAKGPWTLSPPTAQNDGSATEGSSSAISMSAPTEIICPICSVSNDPLRLICHICSHVLDSRKDRHHWKCSSMLCKDSAYINAGDCGVCGVCGSRKQGQVQEAASKPLKSVISGDSGHIAYI